MKKIATTEHVRKECTHTRACLVPRVVDDPDGPEVAGVERVLRHLVLCMYIPPRIVCMGMWSVRFAFAWMVWWIDC